MRARLTALAATAAVITAAAGAEAATLPPGFQDETLASGITTPVSVDWAPDGRMFVASAAGGGKINVFNPGATTPSKQISLTGNVYGIAIDADFASNGFLYAVRSHGSNTTLRLVRVTVLPDSTLANPSNPQTVLLGTQTSNPCPAPSNTVDCITAVSPHDLNTVRSDPRDGTLWVSNGDNSDLGGAGSFNALNEQSYAGKLLHIDRNGNGLPGHPFCPTNNNLTHVCTKVAAMGFRNPFRFTLRPGGGVVVGDVGWGSREEIDLVQVGRSHGWPCYEGTIRTPNYRDNSRCAPEYAKEGTANAAVPPVYEYARTSAGASITGGPTYVGGSYPADFNGDIFFGDYVLGYIKRLKLDSSDRFVAVQDFATDVGPVVDLQLGPGGDLVYVLVNGSVHRIRFTGSANRAPIARASGDPTSGPLPLDVSFRGDTSSDPDGDALTYDWDFGDGTAHSSAANPTHRYNSAGNYTATLTVGDGRGATSTATVNIAAGNNAPIVSIDAPSTYRAGQTVTLRGSATDPEEGSVPASRFEWKARLIHIDHEHDPEAPSGVAETTFTAPTDHDADSFFETTLTATDSAGAKGSTTVRINPETRQLTLDSSPTGATISFGGQDYIAPLVKQTTIGYRTPVSAASSFQRDGTTYEFANWSDGGARLHDFTMPASDLTLAATYQEATGGTPPSSFEAESMSGVTSTGNVRSKANSLASGGREALFVRNATISKTVTTDFQGITVRARGDQCVGAPNMLVEVDGVQVMAVPVTATTFGDFSTDVVNPPSGQHTITIAFTNDKTVSGSCDRNLRVDKVTLSSTSTPPPPPPPPPDPETSSSFEAEGMSGVTSTGSVISKANASASGGREAVFFRNATISKTLTTSAFQRITVRARGDQCVGAPEMLVKIDGVQAMAVPVPQTSLGDYSADVNVPAGQHTITVAFTNDKSVSGSCDRNLRADKVTVSP